MDNIILKSLFAENFSSFADRIDFTTEDERCEKLHQKINEIRDQFKSKHLFEDFQIAVAFHRCCGLTESVIRFLTYLQNESQEVINEELDPKWLAAFPDIGPVDEYYE